MMTVHEEITKENMLEKIASYLPRNYRFITMTVVDCGESFDVLYHFDLDYKMETLRLKLAKGETLPSISGIYMAAFVVENEIQDLFGIKVTDLAIDYEAHFLLAQDAPEQPFCRVPGVGVTAVKSNEIPAANGNGGVSK